MRRARLVILIVLGLVVLGVIGGVLARAFSIDQAERSAIIDLLNAEAKGDAGTMRADIYHCDASAACQARVAHDAATLTRSGQVLILELNESAGFSFGSTTGTARVAWRAGNALPVVQCVRVRRAGNLFSGLSVELLELSARIKSDTDCPPHY